MKKEREAMAEATSEQITAAEIEDARQGKMGDAQERLWRRPGFLFRRCLQQISGVFEQASGDVGLTARQYDYLFVLDVVGESGQGEIGEALGLDRSTNTLVLKILERKKWITREVVAHDTRRRVVRITPEGREAFSHGRDAAAQAVACITDALSHDEYATLITIMRKIVIANLDKDLTSASDEKAGKP